MSFYSKCHCCIVSCIDFSLDCCGVMRQGLPPLGLDSRRTGICRQIFIYETETTKIKMLKRADSPVTDSCALSRQHSRCWYRVMSKGCRRWAQSEQLCKNLYSGKRPVAPSSTKICARSLLELEQLQTLSLSMGECHKSTNAQQEDAHQPCSSEQQSSCDGDLGRGPSKKQGRGGESPLLTAQHTSPYTFSSLKRQHIVTSFYKVTITRSCCLTSGTAFLHIWKGKRNPSVSR